MKFLKRFFVWVKMQFKTHTARSVIATVLTVLVLTTCIVWLVIALKKEPYSLITKRSYILADANMKDPETLEELLHHADPDIDMLLKNPSIIDELRKAESLVEIVDSRIAINNLRSIDQQLAERIEELEKASAESVYLTDDDLPEDEEEEKVNKIIEDQVSLATELKEKTGSLLVEKTYDTLVSIPLNINIKSLWQSPGEVLLHMTPSGDWLPEDGYRIYRIVNGNKQMIAENIAARSISLTNSLKVIDEDIIKEMYSNAELTQEKLNILGVSAEEFRDMAYRTDSLVQKPRVSGRLDFMELQKALITIPASVEQKIPVSDILTDNPIYIQGKSMNSLLSSTGAKAGLSGKFSITPALVPSGIDGLNSMLEGLKKFETAQSIMTARQQLLTLSFVNEEYAEAAGFLFRDDLSELGLSDGTEIKYIVESPTGESASVTVKYGDEIKLSKPEGLIGYGIDNKVPLRWEQTTDEREKSIISGYFIERKLRGEKEFKVINTEPVVITYTLDETDIYFETPVFYEDKVLNGMKAYYRIYSIDIFGRKSEYSDTLEVKVEKVTPPNLPIIETPALSNSAQNVSDAVKDAIALNSGKLGIVLPIFSESNDTACFVIYRAEAYGTGKFGVPEIIATIKYNNPAKRLPLGSEPVLKLKPKVERTKIKKAKQIILAEISDVYPDLVYFDAEIKKGYTYKYWVSAWDSWNNESAWSQSVTVGVPLSEPPKLMDNINITMHQRALPDYSEDPPGVVRDNFVSSSGLKSSYTYPTRKSPADVVVGTIEKAESEGSFIGKFLSDNKSTRIIDNLYNNLPDDKYFHMFIGVLRDDILPDGTVRLKWPAYSGDGFKGYVVYKALFKAESIEELQKMSRTEIMKLGRWKRINNTAVTQNQIVVGGLANSTSDIEVFLVCVEPEGKNILDVSIVPVFPAFARSLIDAPEGGFVYVSWQAPADPQIEYYRVYRSEVDSFKNPIDESKLEWTLVGDRVKNTLYTERVDQSFAHYYYYKVTSVSLWGFENDVGVVSRFRVPSTKPPQTPNMLLPLSRKDGIQINFSSVSHCDRYEIYRTAIPVIDDIFIQDSLIDNSIINALFSTAVQLPKMRSSLVIEDTRSFINPINKFKTLTLADSSVIVKNLIATGDSKCLDAFNLILEKAGPLALADYADLSMEMLKRIRWTKVGEVPAASEEVDPATGLLKPLSFIDTTAEYGVVYLYTVQAWNDDNLGSTRPEPVEATTRRNKAFDPIDGLKGEIKNNVPTLSWNPAKMGNLTPEKCRQDTVGYIVYRADSKDGEYYQASSLLFETKWEDTDANTFAYNWYKVKVLDTGGYLSEFSEAVLVRTEFSTNLVTVIPPFEQLPKPPDLILIPKITLGNSQYTVNEGTQFSAQYTLTGTEPIVVTVSAKDDTGANIEGFSVDSSNKRVNGSIGLPAGVYRVTLSATNSAGQSTFSFTLTVNKKIVIGRAPKLTEREDEYNFRMNRIINFSVQLSASGTQPLTWSLQPISERQKVPSQASISSNGVLTIDRTIVEGTHSFYVAVSNSFGTDRREIVVTVTSIIIPPIFGLDVIPDNQYKTSSMKVMNFQLTDVELSTLDTMPNYGYIGTAKLDIGYSTPIPVDIRSASFTKKGENGSAEDIMTRGTVYLKEPYYLEDLGITLISLDISPHRNLATVSGTVKSKKSNQNLFGDIYGLEFDKAELKYRSIVMKKDIPKIRYNQYSIYDISELWIRMNGSQTSGPDLIVLVGSKVNMKFHLETLSNEELEFEQATQLSFDIEGKMSGVLHVTKEQSLQLLVPGGAALRVDDAMLNIVKGNVTNGMLSGKLVLPFEQGFITATGVPGTYAKPDHPETNEMDDLASGQVSDGSRGAMQEGLIHFGETVQQNGLLIVPKDFYSQDKCAFVPIYVSDWEGKGFVIENAFMSSSRITERSLDLDTQRAQAMVLTPYSVTVDLDRESYLTKAAGSQTPNETEKPFWVGLVIKGGKLTLPPAFIQKDGGGAVEFILSEGEMIYDLNGFNYQSYLYSTEGVPADFGSALGSFTDAIVYDCLLDLYANKVNLEINAEVKVELFRNNWVKVKLYTNKEDNEDGKAGEFLCSVAPTLIENALGDETDIRIDGGWLKPDGMHLNGSLILPSPDTEKYEFKADTPLSFTDMLVPPELNKMRAQTDPERKYGSAVLDKPANVNFNGFTYEIREFDLEYLPSMKSQVKLSLRGATLLSDNIPLSTETRDSLIIKYPVQLGNPVVEYSETYAILDANFDDCVTVMGRLVPKLVQNGKYMEFETSLLEFAFLKQLKNISVVSNTRFGYDFEKDRCYYAIGITAKNSNSVISIGAGEIKDFAGLIAYNMVVSKDDQNRYVFPEKTDQMKNYISNLAVYNGNKSELMAGVKGAFNVVSICEIRNLYFGFESGPKVEAGGELYLPLDVSAIVGNDAYKKVGSVVMKYRHAESYFSFSMTLDRIDLILASVSGSMGFEYSPTIFGVYLGYPETLVGNIGVFHVGAGVGFRIDDNGASMIQAKMELGLEKEVNVSIVYLRGYLYAGADGSYWFDTGTISLELYLKGGLEGGIKVGGKRYNIISFYLDARGTVSSSDPYDSWLLECSCRVSYSLDLWICSVEGSVTASFNTRIG